MPEARSNRLRELLGVNGPDLPRFASRCANELPDISGISIVVVGGINVSGLVSAAGQRSERLAELQLTMGEGPGTDAYRTGQPVLIADLSAVESQGRWPGFASAAVDLGVKAMFGFPLQLGAIRIGTLDLHRVITGPLSGEELPIALVCAEAATMLLLGAAAMPGDSLLSHRAVIHQATGMVMVQLESNIEEAFVRLRAHAYASGQPLGELAQDVVDRRMRFQANS
ncbi:MAG TPA: GAF domain protein [Micromonosporaceae bacterium]|nr:GAF domain protein [Micromonosporaceae bacterium]